MEDTQAKIDSRYAALLMDCGFKAVFGDDRNKDVVISLLNRFLEGEHHIVDPRVYEQRADRGVSQDFFARSVYYGSKVYSLQHKKGKKRYDTSPTGSAS